MPMLSRRRLSLAPAASLGLALTLMTTPALAQQAGPAAPSGQASDSVLHMLNLKAKPTTAPDFVTRTRPDASKMDYIPVGAPHRAPETKPMTPAEVAAMTADLDNARAAQQRRAGLKPAVVPDRVKKQATKPGAATVR